MTINSISDFRKAVRNGAYAWPGGYPVFWLMDDGGVLAFDVCKTERHNMLESLATNSRDGWRPVALEINWEDTEMFCAHTGARIEAAYEEKPA